MRITLIVVAHTKNEIHKTRLGYKMYDEMGRFHEKYIMLVIICYDTR